MSAEERESQASELEHEIAREWLRFAITEAVVIWLPLTLFLLVYVSTASVSQAVLVGVVVAGGAACGALVLYWLFKRVRPRQEELAAIRRYAS
jgi:hypothetical protein